MTSNEIKSALYNHYRYKKQIYLIADEVLTFRDQADILMIDKNDIITEIEIKTSLSDLKADFKKHHYRLTKEARFTHYFERHYFYFCVPYELKGKALEIISSHDDRFGLLYAYKPQTIVEDYFFIYIAKKAKLLNKDIDERSISNLKSKILQHLSARVCILMKQKYNINNKEVLNG